jgi:hypothetical protein
MLPLRSFAVVLLVCINAASIASAVENSAKQKLDPHQLEIGDWYEASIQWQGTRMPLQGALVKMTDEWLVLGCVLCQSSERATMPALQELIDACDAGRLADIPLVGALLTRRESYYSKSYFWIPRNSAKITSRELITNADVKLDFANDSPSLEVLEQRLPESASFALVWIDKGQTSQIECESITVCGDYVSISTDIPGEHKIESRIRFDSVSYIWQMVPYDYREARRSRQGQIHR